MRDFANVDATNVRSEGVCMWGGTRGMAGAPCSSDVQCRSLSCDRGRCLAQCLTDADCGASDKCTAVGLFSSPREEAPREFIGACSPWGGSRATCTANDSCAAGQSCAHYRTFDSFDTGLRVEHACRLDGTGSPAGASCNLDGDCAAGATCLWGGLTGRGYCMADCRGGQADCAGPTSCRSLTIDEGEPGTTADDLFAPFCVETAPGSACLTDYRCTPCASDAQCNAAQGVTCESGVCRDPFGRCRNPCRTDCTPGGANNGGCPAGTTCRASSRRRART